ncbi:hypothetical protein RhiirA5_436432 [Rhizophagus irregularis]|uniref:Uncharacterized protein n=1 Tax=Rhizophagus irregularis TaxID=588596 RepID=A0A2N0NLY8_9GLOM|nr:hypothetical protein RhiirA5_436432 [Rhizophagus irregularis]PKC62411.1 hypothetical protein RhiirA1_465161 [Rhizophagus irregularis]
MTKQQESAAFGSTRTQKQATKQQESTASGSTKSQKQTLISETSEDNGPFRLLYKHAYHKISMDDINIFYANSSIACTKFSRYSSKQILVVINIVAILIDEVRYK